MTRRASRRRSRICAPKGVKIFGIGVTKSGQAIVNTTPLTGRSCERAENLAIVVAELFERRIGRQIRQNIGGLALWGQTPFLVPILTATQRVVIGTP